MRHTYEIAPGRTVQLEEATVHHWVGTYGTLVILILHDGSHEDPTHIHAVTRALTKVLRAGATRAQFLVVFAPTLSKPPSTEVRRAIAESASLAPRIDRAAAVMLGSGFMSAIHRGVVTGILSILRLPSIVRVVSSVADGLEHIYSGDASERTPRALLVRFCEERVSEGGRAHPAA